MSGLTKRVEKLEQQLIGGSVQLMLWGRLTADEINERVAAFAKEKGLHPSRIEALNVCWLE